MASEWPSVRRTCRNLGWDFDGWQDGAAMLILSQRADGEYACDTIVISIPRQVGKTYLVACIIFALCLMKPGLRVIWTAQVKDTALETYEKLVEMASRPLVRPHIFKTPQGKGDEAILFNNGSKIEFGARDSGFGRGRTDVDVLVFDEGQHLSLQALENMGAAQNVAENPLCFVMGTPPRPQDKGEFFLLSRQEALDGESDGTLYIEFSADRGSDPMDREQWRKANASFPHRTSERAMLRLRKKLKNEDSWRREALGIWDEINPNLPVVSKTAWRALAALGPDDGTKPNALAVDMSHSRQISISACWLTGEHAHCEEVWAGIDTDAAAAWLFARAGRRIPVVMDAMSPAAEFAPLLRARRMRVIVTSAADMSKACGQLYAKVKANRFSHANQEAPNDAVEDARKRPIGTAGGWGWDRHDETSYIAPIVSMTLALFGALATTKPTRSGGGQGRSGRTNTGRRATLA
ncbi:terminase [Nocardia sp. NPDC059239]|uniref:terminase n=1 Tax=unclassified Nocardia TaxID=2637762 RepID=UPI0036C21FB4